MQKLAYWIWGYAVLLFVGGLIGFLKAGSVASLVMSSVLAACLAFTGDLFRKGHAWAMSVNLALLASVLLIFIFRFVNSLKPVPGIIALVTFLVLCIVGIEAKKSSK